MINSKIFTLVLIFFSFSSQAQEEEIVAFHSIENGAERDKFIFSLSLLSQLDFNSPSLQFGFDIKLSEGVGIHQELGYINNWLNPIYGFIDQEASQNYKLKNGIKYIFEPRFYLFNKEKKISKSIFFAPSFDFRYVNIFRSNWVGRYNFSYTEEREFNISKLAFGAMAKFGLTIKPNKRMPIDLIIGLGTRYSIKTNDLPDDAEILNNGGGFFFGLPTIEGEQWHPAIYYGMLLHIPTKRR